MPLSHTIPSDDDDDDDDDDDEDDDLRSSKHCNPFNCCKCTFLTFFTS